MKEERRTVKSLLRLSCAFALVSCGPAVVTVKAQQTRRPETHGSEVDEAAKWNTTGLQQANTMGGGPAPIPESRKLRVFVLMGQSNMHGTARAQNRAGREIANVTTIYPGTLPRAADGVHFNAEGYLRLGKITASAVKDYYQKREFPHRAHPPRNVEHNTHSP